MKKLYIYRCPYTTCDHTVETSFELTDYPQCNGAHSKVMDFFESESTGVPKHIADSKQKPVGEFSEDRKVNGGNWIK